MTNSVSALHTASITGKASELGFSLCGFARCEPLEDLRLFYGDFISRKGYATLQYLERNASQRLDPAMLLEGAKSVIAVGYDYYPPVQVPETDNFIVSRYAYGPDYHRSVKAKVNELADFVRSAGEGVRTRAFVDSGTVLEKAWAQRCGIGWQGKNTLVINRERGSYFFIGIILTDLELDVSEPSANHCGECRRCVEACPTGALDHPYRLDIPNCISYQTLENKDEIPEGIKRKLRDRIYGCDICQDACPFNRHAAGHANPGFQPREQLLNYRKKDWIALTEQDFDLIFAGTPVTRLGYRRFMENIRANSANQ